MTNAPRHFSALAKRSSEPPISWLMKLKLERPDLISLAVGFTDDDTLPVEEVAALTRKLLSKPKTARATLQYGTTAGLPQLRHEILRRWQWQDRITNHQSPITSDDVIVTTGSQQLLYLVSEVLCDPGDIVIVEDPTYFVYLGIVEAMGIRAVGFDSISYLKSKLEDLKRRRLLPRLKMLYLVTYCQNPTGRTWSLEMKREALAIVKHYERVAGHPIYIVEDAAYRDLRFEGDPAVAGFKSLDPHNERVVYANTLTKPFATGFRLGYGILPPLLMRAVARSKGNHDFGSSNFLQAILARALAEGVYDRHLPKIAAGYRRKRDVMMVALAAAFANSARYDIPHGGMYVWVELDQRVKTGVKSRLFKRALDAGVLYVPGEMCYCKDPSRPIPQNCMRLSFGAPTIQQIQKGIRLLANALG
jgi:2-aminoadipate transaminase